MIRLRHARRLARPIATLAAVSMVLAACGGDGNATPSAAAPTPSPAVQPSISQAPTLPPLPTGGLPSFPLPSGGGDPELEALFPASLGGENLSTTSLSGDQLATSPYGLLLQGYLADQGKTLADASAGFGGTAAVTIIAYRVHGVPAEETLDYLIEAAKAIVPGTVSVEIVGGKSVTKMTPDSAAGSSTYSYTHDDVVFVIGGDDLTDALLAEALTKLP
jgi:hypothetical protein